MIKSKDDYLYFLQEDALANIKTPSCNWFKMRLNLWYGNESYMFLQYMRALRKYEYLLNCNVPFKGVRIMIAKARWHRIGARINVIIKPNIVNYGLRIPHLVGGVIVNCKSVGYKCTINTGVIIGNNSKGDMATIGNNVEIAIGAKVIGGVLVGDGAIIAPNSVVVKDVPENAIVSGIPAKILKFK